MTVAVRPETLLLPLSPSDFEAFARSRPNEERWQLIDGHPVMMSPGTFVHNLIAHNLEVVLNDALEATKPEWLALRECGVAIGDTGRFIVDVGVFDAEGSYEHYRERFFLAAEVLSPANSPELIETKIARYCEAPINRICLVLAQDRMSAELYVRGGTAWQKAEIVGADARLILPEFGVNVALQRLYARTPVKG